MPPPPRLAPGARIAEASMGAPPQPSPDVRERATDKKKENIRRGARITGGPGTKELDSTLRLASRVKAGKASVLQLQTQLRRAGFDIALDGEWGPQTEASWRTLVERHERALLESTAMAPAVSFSQETEDRQKRAELQNQEDIRASMQDYLAAQPKPQSAYDRWGILPNIGRAGSFVADKFAAPVVGSTADFFQAIPFIVEAKGDPFRAYELNQQNEQRLSMGYADAEAIQGAAKLADRFVQDVYQSTIGAPAALGMMIADPVEAVKQIWAELKYRYGPLVGGDLDKFASRQAEHPLFFVLDVAGVTAVAVRGLEVGGLLKQKKMIRKLRVGEGYVQLYQPGSSLGKHLAARLDAFSEKHPDLAFIGANTRGGTALRQQADRTLDELRAVTIRFEKAAKRLNSTERMAYDVLARYGDDAPAFLELEINKRWAAAHDEKIPRPIRSAQKAQHFALRQAAADVKLPSERLKMALALGRELTEGPDVSTESMKFSLRMLDPETAKGRKELWAQIFGEVPTVGEVKSRSALYQHLRELFPEPVALANLQTFDSAALHWSRANGQPAEQYYAQNVSKFRAAIDPDLPENLPEGIDVLYQDGLFDAGAYEQARAAKAAARDKPPIEPSDMPESLDVRAIADAVAGFKLPTEIATPAKLRKAIERVYEYARRGAAHRDWYDRAAEVAKTVAAQFNITPDQSAQLFAIYSQAADVVGNAKFVIDAIRAYQETGTTASVGRFPARQHVEADAVLAGKPWSGRKRSSFYANIIESVDPVAWRELNGGKPVTVDRWVTRMFIPKSKTDVPGTYYDAMERLITAMADQLGWEPKEIQAAAWVSIKSDALRELRPAWSEARIMRAAADAYEEGYRRHGAQGSIFDVGPLDDAENLRGLVMDFAGKAIKDVQEPDGGFTVFADTLRSDSGKEGYAVAFGAYERKIPAEAITDDDLRAYVNDHQYVLDTNKDARVGGWHNPDDGQVYLDIVRVVESRREAENFMQQQGQLSMLDREAANGRGDWDNAFISSGLAPGAADEIKGKLRTIDRWEKLVEAAARDQLGAGTRVGSRQFDTAEDIILQWADDHPNSPFSKKIQDLYLASHEARQAPDPDGPNRLWQEEDAGDPDWVIPEDTEAWVKQGAREIPEDLASQPDIPFEGGERILPIHEIDDGTLIERATADDLYDLGRAQFIRAEILRRGQNDPDAQEHFMEALDALNQRISELGGGLKPVDMTPYPPQPGTVRRLPDESDGDFQKRQDAANADFTMRDAAHDAQGPDDTFPEEWNDRLAQAEPSPDDYKIVSERPGQVGVTYNARPKGTMYFPDREAANLFIEDQVKRRKYLLENHPDLYYQRTAKFGIKVNPEGGAARGVTDFALDPGKAAIGLNPELANASTPLHEQAHVIRRFLPPESMRKLEDILDVKDGVWKRADDEKFAKMVETYFWRGHAPNWQLRSLFAEMRAGMREVYGEKTGPRPGGVSSEDGLRLYGLLDEIFNPTLSLKAGDKAFYMPDVASWRARGATSGRRKSLRQAKIVKQKNRGVLAGQGRIQRGPKVTLMEFNRVARLYESRLTIQQLREFASKPDFDNHPETGGIPPGYGLFNPDGVEVPRVFRETPTSDDLYGRFPHEMAREMQQQRDELLAASFPTDLEKIPQEYRDKALVLPLQVIEAFTGDKAVIRLARSPRLDKMMAGIDMTNAVFKAALIYGKLSYIPLNFAGNMVFLSLAAGPFAGPALVRAARGLGGIDPELLAHIDLLVGEGAAAALAMEDRNALTRGINKLAYAQSAVADRLPRRAAWIYYAGRAGFISEGAIRKLLEGSDEVWKDGVTFKEARFQISEAAERSMVQFRGMSPFQQEVISRTVFIYGWIRGATKYGLHSAVERPLRTSVMLQLGQDEWDEMQERFGKLVSYIDGVTPVGAIQKMLGVEVVPVRSTQAINPVSTAGEALAAIYNTAKGDMNQAGPTISDYLSPVLKTGIEFATGIDLFTGEKYDHRWEAITGQPGRWPAVKVIKGLIAPEVTDADVAQQPVERQPNYIIPSKGAGRREALEELFLGAARERNLNFKAAEARGREQRGEKKGYADYREELIGQMEEAGLGTPPKIALDELRFKVKLEADERMKKGSTPAEKLAAVADIWAERYGDKSMVGVAKSARGAVAEKLYEDLRKRLFSNINYWERQSDKVIDARLEQTP